MKAKFSQLASAFDRLSGRDQALALALSLAILLMLVGGGGYFIRRDLGARDKRIAAKTDKLKEIAALRTDYQRRLGEQNRLANEVRGNKSVRILSYLEDLSRKANIELSKAAERPGDPTGSDQVTEETAEVSVSNVSLDRLYEFLNQIELGNRLVKVRRLKVKTRFDNKEMLDASITVGTYKPTASGST